MCGLFNSREQQSLFDEQIAKLGPSLLKKKIVCVCICLCVYIYIKKRTEKKYTKILTVIIITLLSVIMFYLLCLYVFKFLWCTCNTFLRNNT